MTLNALILSDKTRERVIRHLLFLCAYSWLFHFQNDNRTLLYAACFLPACILAAYSFVYILLPFLKKKKYSRFVFGLLIIYLTTMLLAYAGSTVFFIWWDGPVTGVMIFGVALHNQIIAMCVGVVALGIKTTKNLYVRQKENLALQKQKVRNELRLEKANLYPEFILQALNSLQLKIMSGAAESPTLLLKLSDTLSYILYESQDDLIALDKELMMVKNIIEFKKISYASHCAIRFSVVGDLDNKCITPLTLFRLIENLFQMIGNEEGPIEADIKISIEDEFLFFKLICVYSLEKDGVDDWENLVIKVQTTINRVHQGACELKVAEDERAYSIFLTLGLSGPHNPTKRKLTHNQISDNVLA
jgi:sensor histidine kinase YesM